MRFPRSLGIRDDLTVEDCMTATGMEEVYPNESYTHHMIALFDTFKERKKRKMSEDDGEGCVELLYFAIGA